MNQLFLRRILALGLPVMAVAVLAAVIVLPIRYFDRLYDTRIENLRQEHLKFSGIAARGAALKATLDEFQARRPTVSDLLAGESSALAGAGLQERVKAIVQRDGGSLQSMQMLKKVRENKLFERVTVRVKFSGTITSLQRVLHDLEGGKPVLFVEGLEVNRRGASVQQSGPGSATGGALRILIDVFGYRKGEQK